MSATFVLSFLLCAGVEPTTAAQVDDSDASPWVEKSLVILKSTKNFAAARKFATTAAQELRVKLDLRDLAVNKKTGLTFPKALCEKEFNEFPCYQPRGRWDDGVYVSIEHSSGYTGFRKGLFIVVLANGSKEDPDLRAALRTAKAKYPDAYVKRTTVYLGCMH